MSHYVRKDGTVVERPYGSQYHSLLTAGNIKFVKKNDDAEETLMETMTRGRVYVEVGSDEKLKRIVYFDNDNKRTKQIDLAHPHKGIGMHVHHGYLHNESESSKLGASRLTTEEREMVSRVNELWNTWSRE